MCVFVGPSVVLRVFVGPSVVLRVFVGPSVVLRVGSVVYFLHGMYIFRCPHVVPACCVHVGA